MSDAASESVQTADTPRETPNLPVELLYSIFELAGATGGVKVALKLSMVSRAVRDLLRPIAFSVFTQVDGSPSFPDFRLGARHDRFSSDEEYMESLCTHARHLLIDGGYDGQKTMNPICRCENVTDLWIFHLLYATSAFLPALERLKNLKRLCGNLDRFQEVDFEKWQVFERLEYIGACDFLCHDWKSRWTCIASMPNLTHLMINSSSSPSTGLVRTLLLNCPTLKVILVERSGPGCSDWLRLERVEDARLVLVETSVHCQKDWANGAEGKLDIWAFADLVSFARSRKLFIDNTQRWIHRPLSWIEHLNDDGKEWFSTLHYVSYFILALDSGNAGLQMSAIDINDAVPMRTILPPELQFLIFEHAASMGTPKDKVNFMQVSRAVHDLIKPALYRIFKQVSKSRSFPKFDDDVSGASSPNRQSLAALGPYARHLIMAGPRSAARISQLISSCPNTENLAIWSSSPFSQILPSLEGLDGLKKLSADFSSIPSTEFTTSKVLNGLTHLDVIGFPGDGFSWDEWSVLTHMPYLTNIMINDPIDTSIVENLLRECPALRVLILLDDSAGKWAGIGTDIKDARLVLLDITRLRVLEDWVNGAEGKLDTWAFAGLVAFARQQSFFRNNSQQWVSRPFPWNNLLNEDGKRWFSTLGYMEPANSTRPVFQERADEVIPLLEVDTADQE
ncbi:hypothetical protein CVT26_000676 [Gymnopilus dilepis]|uniref:F-box domain-containing protein n=1 Tax=Gymnopilus dilepis TaxID=231916 RepID=A0A409WL08_9AGAR|nr:hypothetical protein CVT26_000676 [Gymnopilus dilepis]